MKPVFDATFYSGKPASDVLTFSAEHVTPCLTGCTPIVITDRGAFGHNWRTSADTTSMDRAEFRAFADALPPGMTVCLDIEGEPKAVTETLVYALRSVRERRPDVRVGFYAGHSGYRGHMHGDRKFLPEIELTTHDRRALRYAHFVAQACYWRCVLPDDWNTYTPLDKARTALHLSWAYHACRRWKIARPTLEVYPILTGTLMGEVGHGTPLGATQIAHAAKEAARWDGVILWDGTEWNADGTRKGEMAYEPRGRKFVLGTIASLKAA